MTPCRDRRRGDWEGEGISWRTLPLSGRGGFGGVDGAPARAASVEPLTAVDRGRGEGRTRCRREGLRIADGAAATAGATPVLYFRPFVAFAPMWGRTAEVRCPYPSPRAPRGSPPSCACASGAIAGGSPSPPGYWRWEVRLQAVQDPNSAVTLLLSSVSAVPPRCAY